MTISQQHAMGKEMEMVKEWKWHLGSMGTVFTWVSNEEENRNKTPVPFQNKITL